MRTLVPSSHLSLARYSYAAIIVLAVFSLTMILMFLFYIQLLLQSNGLPVRISEA